MYVSPSTCSEQKLIRQKVDVLAINATVESEDGLRVPVKLLDCDTISQAKEKLLDCKYKAAPVSIRPRLTEVDLGEQHPFSLLSPSSSISHLSFLCSLPLLFMSFLKNFLLIRSLAATADVVIHNFQALRFIPLLSITHFFFSFGIFFSFFSCHLKKKIKNFFKFF